MSDRTTTFSVEHDVKPWIKKSFKRLSANFELKKYNVRPRMEEFDKSFCDDWITEIIAERATDIALRQSRAFPNIYGFREFLERAKNELSWKTNIYQPIKYEKDDYSIQRLVNEYSEIASMLKKMKFPEPRGNFNEMSWSEAYPLIAKKINELKDCMQASYPNENKLGIALLVKKLTKEELKQEGIKY